MFLPLAMVLCMFVGVELSVSAETSGTTGDCTWAVDGTTLTISGNGDMGDYYFRNNVAPWGTDIEKVVIENGVTSIGDYAFIERADLTSVLIPASVTDVGVGAFYYCSSLESVLYIGSESNKEKLVIADHNDILTEATWKYAVGFGNTAAEIVDNCVTVPAISGYFTDANGRLHFPGELIGANPGDVFVPAPIEVAADNAFSFREDFTGIRARGALSKETVETASEIGFVMIPRIAPDLSADWYVSSQYTYKQPVNKNAIYGVADEIDGYQYQLCLWNLKGFEAEEFLFAMYATVDGVTTYTYVGCVSYCLVSGTTPPVPEKGIIVNGVKLDNKYTLVVPQYNMSYLVRIQLEELQKAFASECGITLKEATDATAPAFTQDMVNLYYGKSWGNCETTTDYKNYVNAIESLDKTKTKTEYIYEIVIGDCDRAGCPVISDKNQYTIKVWGNKIFLNGGSPAATAMAVSEFTKMVNSGPMSLTNASTIVGNYNDAISNYSRDNYYTLTWGDDFDGTVIDTNKWYVSYGRDSTVYDNGLNGRMPARGSRTLNNNYVKDGKLYICATYDNNYYYGGHLSTDGIMSFTYGYVETSCLKPFGQGFWTSLWVDNYRRDTGLGRMEIDVNESYGPGHVTLQNTFSWVNYSGIDSVLSKYNFRIPYNYAFNKTNIQYNSDNRGFYLDFHTFGYGWDENELFFTIDGKVTSRYDYATAAMVFGNASSAGSLNTTIENARAAEIEITKSAFATPAFLRVSMAVGFSSREFVVPDGNKEWTETNKFIVDYVHVYQLAGQQMYFY